MSELNGRFREADALYERAIAIQRQSLAPDDPEVALTLHDWALLCQARGHHQRARLLWAQAQQVLANPNSDDDRGNNEGKQS